MHLPLRQELRPRQLRSSDHGMQRCDDRSYVKRLLSERLERDKPVMMNFGWYIPSNTRWFCEREVRELAIKNGMLCSSFHVEEACYSVRFAHVADFRAASPS